MGKNGGGGSSSSWLAAIKRAFRSPIKDPHNNTCTRKRDQHEHDPEPEDHHQKKREKKRRWLFRKSISQTHEEQSTTIISPNANYGEKQAISAVEIIRLIRTRTRNSSSVDAAIVIQTAFRAYLARRALRALRGIVKLQALVRGQNVRRQAKMTLKCMQVLLRVQGRLRCDQHRPRDVVRKSMFVETTTNLWEPKYLQDIRQRKSTSGEERCMRDDWDEVPQTLEELDAILKSRNRKEAAIKREKSLAYAFSQQFDSHVKMSRSPSFGNEKELEGSNWQRERARSSSRASREPIKTLEVDMSRPYYSNSNICQKTPYSNQQTYNVQPPVTPSPSKTRPLPSPQSQCYSNTNTPRSSGRFNASMCRYSSCANDVALPNYMADTESARARVRPQSAPRQRPSMPERERSGSVKKRLAYDPCDEDNYFSYSQNLTSPSFKSVQVGYVGMSCYADSSVGGEISPCSTTELRRWFR